MEKRIRVSSGAIWEDKVGYCRAIKIGNVVEVAGTTASNSEGEVIGVGNAYVQTKYIIEKAQIALKELGLDLNNVIRTRMFVTNIDLWEAIGKAHGEFFRDVKPVATMVEVKRLIHPDLLVEMEFSAMQ